MRFAIRQISEIRVQEHETKKRPRAKKSNARGIRRRTMKDGFSLPFLSCARLLSGRDFCIRVRLVRVFQVALCKFCNNFPNSSISKTLNNMPGVRCSSPSGAWLLFTTFMSLSYQTDIP